MSNQHLEDNVRKLLSNTEPELEMPREGKERVLSRLKGRAAKPKMVLRRPLSWATAAAAAAVLLFLLFWPGGMDGALAWADVVKHFSEVESLIARLTLEEIAPSGVARVTTGRLYQMNPGMSRSELYTTDVDEPETIIITNSGLERSSILRLSPREKVAHMTTLTFSGTALEEREGMSRDIVTDAWSRLERVTADQASSIGEAYIDGVLAVGFEIDIREIFRGPRAKGIAGTMRVWAEQLTGMPLEVEAEFLDPSGTLRRTTFSEIEWNAILDEELFEIPDLEGWQVVEEECLK
jgi:outer membrane lipoprotein-sorting protein